MNERTTSWKYFKSVGEWGPFDTTKEIQFEDYELSSSYTITYVYKWYDEDAEIGSAGAMEPVSFIDFAISLDRTEMKIDKALEEIDKISQKVDLVLNQVATEYKPILQEELEEKILEFVEEQGQFWPDELAKELGVDPFLVIDVCEKLVVEGKLKGEELEGEVIEPK